MFIKTSSSPKKIEINLSDMNFYKVANKTEFQHYKEVFKIFSKKTIFNTANNHILDFQKEGMLDSFANLKQLNIEPIGSGTIILLPNSQF